MLDFLPEEPERITEEEDFIAGKELKLQKKERGQRSRQRFVVPDARKLRNLKQYRDMSDEKFDEAVSKKFVGVQINKEFETRIQRKIDQFAEDYDLADLNSNDKLTLRALAQGYINFEDLENEEYNVRKGGINLDNVLLLEKISNMKIKLGEMISKLSDDLKITRKVRRTDKDQTVLTYIEELKRKAKEFYDATMMLIFCPKCGTWIGSIWSLFPLDPRNKITLVCDREMEDGSKCGEKITLTTKELSEMGKTNRHEIPESLK